MIYVDPASIVKEYKIGNCTIKISNEAYKNNTPEDEERILNRLALTITRITGVPVKIVREESE